jgi:hypothetical protein
MEPDHAPGHDAHDRAASPSRLALAATVHCLSGCAIGEVAGMVIGTAAGWPNSATVVLSIVLAFISGYAMTTIPLLRAGMSTKHALSLALASDSISITIMEIVDNAVMLVIPGAMSAGLGEPRFWLSLAISLLLAGVAAYPANRWLISRGKGHAVLHAHHH